MCNAVGHGSDKTEILKIFRLWLLLLINGVGSFFFSELHFPKNLEELNKLVGLLRMYQLQNPFFVFVLFCCAYLYKQTFAIPGSVFMVRCVHRYLLHMNKGHVMPLFIICHL